MAQEMICEDNRHHGFTDRDGADSDARIVATLRDDFSLVALRVDGFARRQD
jgi:hypothetical protein